MEREILIALPGQGGIEEKNPEATLLDRTIQNYEKLLTNYPGLDIRRIFGNSSGLYAAIIIGGVASYFVAKELLEIRSRIVRETEGNSKYPTAMVAVVGHDKPTIAQLIGPVNDQIRRRNELLPKNAEQIPSIEITNDNGYLAKVLGGPREYLAFLAEKLGGRARQLNIPAAYHHSARLQDSISYAKEMRGVTFCLPDRVVISSTDVRILKTPEDIFNELVGQMTRPVDLPAVAEYWKGVWAAIDNGPGDTMKKLFSRIVKEIPILSAEADGEKIAELRQNGKIS